MTRDAPRYDVPNAAPEPLLLVQRFVNTVNLESGDEWLRRWFEERGVTPDPAELERARVLREAVRELLYANNHHPIEGDPWTTLRRAADAAELSIDFARQALVPRAPGADGLIGTVLVTAFTAMADGTWPRLKVCRNHGCRWAFYDYSKNRSASWCSMQLCGNRTKTRAYRARSRQRRA
ncbi:MAG TPA: CGNR zinc finger domain-containing protein [Gaiellaceae bacterium]|nr:CGNR zinc finger domain-containing protein [Gaiellaceae bacterium]